MATKPGNCYLCLNPTDGTPPVKRLTTTKRRIEGKASTVRVCEQHRILIDAVRTSVAGISDKTAPIGSRTTAARHEAERAVYGMSVADVTTVVESYTLDRPAAERYGASFLDADILRQITNAARAHGNTDSERDHLFGQALEDFSCRVADRVMRYEPCDIPRIVRSVLMSNTSERKRSKDNVSSDAPHGQGEGTDKVALWMTFRDPADIAVEVADRVDAIALANEYATLEGPKGDAARAYLADIA